MPYRETQIQGPVFSGTWLLEFSSAAAAGTENAFHWIFQRSYGQRLMVDGSQQLQEPLMSASSSLSRTSPAEDLSEDPDKQPYEDIAGAFTAGVQKRSKIEGHINTNG